MERARLERLVTQGLSTAEIAAALGMHPKIVAGWMREWDLPSQEPVRRRRADAVRPRQAGICERHGPGEFVVRGDGSPRCVRCRSESVSEARRRRKALLVAEAGGACVVCGYDRYPGALQFHHRDPETKRFAIAHRGASRSLTSMREVAAKCVLLCGNCHAEIDAGLIDMPLQ